ncbi:PREDICTED: M-phase inducer phosphatase 3 isoform X2 [Thamnophis sirtalis]|uniref:M-phase inducer phosphatase n=1 Tax=Thamnophis sirtalis TaxID=35019 RepID=A0A6I9XTS3_9SAUR|nr:PREDICTED: M-phase inducer phosphatase 3 isoform X2 [Thamnophis sirtalis]
MLGGGEIGGCGIRFQSNYRMALNMIQDVKISLLFTPEPPLTPVLNLTWDFQNLSTLAGDTPRRCLDLSNLSSGEEEIAFTFSQPPEALEIDKNNLTEFQDQLDSRKQCVQLFQPEVLCSTPSYLQQISGNIRCPSMNKINKAEDFMDCEMKSLGSLIDVSGVPEALDSFSDELCSSKKEETKMSLSSMAALLSGPLRAQDINISEQVSMKKSCLFRSPSLPAKLSRPASKRTVKGYDDETPAKVTWKCSPIQEGPEGVMLLKKTASLSDIEIIRALDQDHGFRQLIGDFSSVYALPTVTGRHSDLRYITADTVVALLHNQFQSLVEKFYIIDCRYPYEYHGGHIKGALNIHRQVDLFEHFLRKPLLPSSPQKRLFLVFHCEFSSERGPKMCRYLREEDRAMNEYPALHYPELYVLQGGYKEFFLENKELCEPQSYCPMDHQDFKAEMAKFHVKSKTWAGERRRRDHIVRLMKL